MVNAQIAKLRTRVKELEEANSILAKANKQLREQMEGLDRISKRQADIIVDLDSKQRICKQKCEVALSEKDRLLREKEQKLANVKTLKDIRWTANTLTNGKIILEGIL